MTSKTPAAMLGAAGLLFVLSSAPCKASTYVVDRLTDVNPAAGGQGANFVGDLRYATGNAQSGDAIAIHVTGTIQLAGALPVLARDLSIQGPGGGLLTVQGFGGSVFAVGSGAIISLSGLKITGGSGNGGGIFNQGTLTVNDSTVSGNTAGDPTNGNGTGAGIWNYVNATLTLNRSTVSNNSAVGNLFYAPSRGGGIANYGTLTLNNSTIAGNTANQGFGGGISNSLNTSTLTLNNSTVSGNSSPGTSGSGGIDNRGTLIAGNSIVAGNAGGDLAGNLTSDGYNLFGAATGSGFAATDLVGVTPSLGPLQDNGGPTATMTPLPGSLAVDRIPGTPGVDFLATDQRGTARPQGSLADIGAVEVGLLPCTATPTALCVNGGRFRVEVAWQVPSQGTSGAGKALPLTGDAGYFWFFSANNVELVVKIVDGRPFNGHFWLFSGALSDVAYTITVTDTATGAVRTYSNPSGRLASFSDVSTF